MRGLVGHLVYGAVVAFVVEAAWLLLGAQPPKRVSGHTVPGGHRLEPEPVLVDAGESRILAVLELRVCNDEQEVALDEIEPLTVMGDGATLDGFVAARRDGPRRHRPGDAAERVRGRSAG